MEKKDFFSTIEKEMREVIPIKLKTHLKFHNVENFQLGSKLTKENINEMEEFARSILHKVIQPNQMIQYYGGHFQEKPELFIFTIGERGYLQQIKQICEKKFLEQQKPSATNEIASNSGISSGKHVISTQDTDVNKQQTNVHRSPEKDETISKHVERESKQISIQGLPNQESDSKIASLDLFKHVCPICGRFSTYNRVSGLLNSFGYIDMKFQNKAFKDFEVLNRSKNNGKFSLPIESHKELKNMFLQVKNISRKHGVSILKIIFTLYTFYKSQE